MTDHVLAGDLSLRSTGAAAITADGRVTTWRRQTDPAPTDHDQALQIRDIARWFRGLVTVSTRLVVLEAPSFGSQHGSAHERDGLWWMTRWYLARAEMLSGAPLPVGRVAPTTVKARVAGHGQADKAVVRSAVNRLYPGQGLARVSYDEADAVAIAVLGVIRLAAIWPDQWTGPWLDARALAPDAGEWEHLPDPQPRAPTGAAPGPMFAAPERTTR